MIPLKFVFRAPATLALLPLVLSLAACGPSQKEITADAYCPTPFTVEDARTLTRFAAGASQDPRNVLFEAELGAVGFACKLGKNQMELNLTLQIGVNAGPANQGVASVPYFVRVLGANNAVMQGREFNADFKFSKSSPRGVSQEQLTLHLPFAQIGDMMNYRIAVGLRPTQQELDYTRRAGGASAR
jgi:hypothetical protein